MFELKLDYYRQQLAVAKAKRDAKQVAFLRERINQLWLALIEAD